LSYSGGENISATIYRFSLIFISLMRMVNLYRRSLHLTG